MEKHGILFGTIAVRRPNGGFLTTGRGKKELESIILVKNVDHSKRMVTAVGPTKATLNAPLLDCIFRNYPQVETILHFHHQHLAGGVPTQEWFPPGTVLDSVRNGTSFNIKGHGCVFSYDKEGNMVV